MKKRLLLLLTLPLIVACGNKNKNSQSETSASSDYSTSIESEESSSTSSSSSEDEPEIPEYEEIEPVDQLDPSTLNPINQISITLAVNEAIGNVDLFNSVSYEYGEGRYINLDKIYGYLSTYDAYLEKDSFDSDFYFDDLGVTSKGTYTYYENVGTSKQYFYGYDYEIYDYSTEPDESNNAVRSFYQTYDNAIGHDAQHDYFYEETINLSPEDFDYSLNYYLRSNVQCLRDLTLGLTDPNYYYGEKDGLFYLGYTLSFVNNAPTMEMYNNVLVEGKDVYNEFLTIRYDEELGYVFDSYFFSCYSYYLNDIFGNKYEEGINYNFTYENCEFVIKDLGSFVEPTIPEDISSPSSFYPLFNVFSGNGPYTDCFFCFEFLYCGSRNGLECYSFTFSLGENAKFSISNYDDDKNGISLLNNENVMLNGSGDYIVAYDDPTYKNIYRLTNSCRINIILKYDIETDEISIDAAFICDDISVL